MVLTSGPVQKTKTNINMVKENYIQINLFQEKIEHKKHVLISKIIQKVLEEFKKAQNISLLQEHIKEPKEINSMEVEIDILTVQDHQINIKL